MPRLPDAPSRLPSVATLLLSARDVTALLPMAECIEVMSDAMRALADGRGVFPLRQMMSIPGTPNVLALMPGYLDAGQGAGGGALDGVIGAKVLTIFPGNQASAYDAHGGVVLLFDAVHGRLLAVLDASAITALRTAAVSAVATRLLAREDAHVLALLGAGVQAMSHLEAMLCVRRIDDVRVWSRAGERAREFAKSASRRFGIAVRVMPSARQAVESADIICTVTAARGPVLEGAWIAEGAHINAVGAHTADTRELDSAAVKRSRLYVDHREAALTEAGDILIPLQAGEISEAHIRGDLGDLVADRLRARQLETEVTLFKSLGLAVQDLAAARTIVARARSMEVGNQVDLGTREG